MPINRIDTTASVTPYRKTHIRCDVAQTVLMHPPVEILRDGKDIQFGTDADNVYKNNNGSILVTPVQSKMAGVFKEVNNILGTLNPFVAGQGIVTDKLLKTVNFGRLPSELAGVALGSNPNLVATGNQYLSKFVSAAQSWVGSDLAGEVASHPQPVLPSQNIQMDRMYRSTNTYPADQGFTIQFYVPGTPMGNPDFIKTFYWGSQGLLSGNDSQIVGGMGEYCISLSGDGWAYVFGWVGISANLVSQGKSPWIQIDKFKWCVDQGIAGKHFSIHITPYQGTDGQKYIHFLCSPTDSSPSASAFSANALPGMPAKSGSRLTVVKSGVKNWLANYSLPGPIPSVTINNFLSAIDNQPYVSQPGLVRGDIRRDIKLTFQPSSHIHPGTSYINLDGSITTGAGASFSDAPFDILFGVFDQGDSNGHPNVGNFMKVGWEGVTPPGTNISVVLYDATTNKPLTRNTKGDSGKYIAFNLNQGVSMYYAKFTLTAFQGVSPVLKCYRVIKDGFINVSDPGEFTGGIVQEVSISGVDTDITHETASLIVADPNGDLDLFRTRASFHTIIETEYDPTDPTKRVVLFRGYLNRPSASQIGSNSPLGMAGQGSQRSYPTAIWNRYECTLVGMWQRLHEALNPVLMKLGDTNADNTNKVPAQYGYRACTVLRNLLAYAGFTPDMIDVADSDVTMFSAIQGEDVMIFTPGESTGDFVIRIARDLLGYYSFFDANAGYPDPVTGYLKGMWRFNPPPQPPYKAKAAFVTTPPAGAFGMNISTYPQQSQTSIPVVPIQKFSIHINPVAPEANLILAIGAKEHMTDAVTQNLLYASCVNPASYNFFTNPDGSIKLTSDPTSADYMGRPIPYAEADITWNSPAAISWAARRLYDIGAHGIETMTFTAPLIFIQDANDRITQPTSATPSATGYSLIPAYRPVGTGVQPRPLRHYDAITVNGVLYLIRSVNIIYQKDHIQMAIYECQTPTKGSAPIPYGYRMGGASG